MRRLTSIVAVSKDGVIGVGNTLPWRVKTDMKFFKESTSNNVVIMGRKTYDSLGQKPLPNRFNVVVSHEFRLFSMADKCVAATGIDEALLASENALQKYAETFVVGGESMYEQFAPLVDRYLITVIDKHVPMGDTFFREELIGDLSDWNQETLLCGIASDQGDEAAFEIISLTHRYSESRMAARADRISRLRELTIGQTRKAPPRRPTRKFDQVAIPLSF